MGCIIFMGNSHAARHVGRDRQWRGGACELPTSLYIFYFMSKQFILFLNQFSIIIPSLIKRVFWDMKNFVMTMLN